MVSYSAQTPMAPSHDTLCSPLHTGGLVCVTNRIWAERQLILRKIKLQKMPWLSPWWLFSQITAAMLSSPVEPLVARKEDLLPRLGRECHPGSRDSGPSSAFRWEAASKETLSQNQLNFTPGTSQQQKAWASEPEMACWK